MQKIIFAIGAVVVLSTTYTMAQQRDYKGGMRR